MSFRSLGRVLQNIRRAAIVSGAVPRTDGQLLRAYVVEGDEACFDALQRRYGPMVFGVCRRVLRNTHDAEDAFQTTFLVLVRKAARLQRREAVGNWLYGVAYRTALQARAKAARRRKKEAEVQPMAAEASTFETAAQQELHALLDRELNRLPDKYRAPIILCELMGKTKKQAAEQLRCPEGTVSSRLARGRELLRKRLAHLGPELAGGEGAVLLAQTTAQTVPISLYGSTLKAAAVVASGKLTVAGGLTPNVAALLQGVLKSMLLSKLKIVALGVVLAGALLGVGANLLATHRTEVVKSSVIIAPAALVKARVPAQAVKSEKPAGDAVPKERLRYGGRDFNAWRDELHTDLKPQVRIEAIKALGAFGVNGYAEEATAAIIETMKKYDIVEAIKKFGAANQEQVLAQAWAEIAAIGPKALPALAKELESNNVNNRRLAAMALTRVSWSFPTETAPLVVRAFKDEDKLVRNSVLYAIAPVFKLPTPLTGPEKQAVVLTLIQVLKDDDAEIRLQAARALEAAGPEAKAAVPALIKLLEETSPVAKAGMGKGTMKKAPIVPIQQAKGTGGFDDIDDQFGPGGGFGQGMTKKGKGGGFGQPGGGFGGGGPGRPVDEFRRQIVRTLGSIGPEATEAFPVFLVLVKSPYEEYGVRDEAVAALGKMGPAAKECIPVLIGICDRSRPGFERPLLDSAVIALENMGPAAKDAVPVLLRVLNDTQIVAIQGRIQVARALGNIGPAAKEAVPALLEIQSAQYSPQQQLETRAQWLQFQAAAATALKKIQQ